LQVAGRLARAKIDMILVGKGLGPQLAVQLRRLAVRMHLDAAQVRAELRLQRLAHTAWQRTAGRPGSLQAALYIAAHLTARRAHGRLRLALETPDGGRRGHVNG